MESELDWIALKALEKDRRRRYSSAADLAADVNRYLENEADQACPPSFTYSLRKTFRKHRFAVTIAVAVFLSLFLGLVATAWQWQQTLMTQQATAGAMELANKRSELADRRLQIAETVIDGGSTPRPF